jgi:hypothetical protein
MIDGHKFGIAAAVIVAIMLLIGIVFGNNKSLPLNINPHQDIRTICLAAWALLVPAWFTFEEQIWPLTISENQERFRQAQARARAVWTLVGLAIFILVGVTPNNGAKPDNKGQTTVPSTTQ